MKRKHKVITLCGSYIFKEDFLKVQEKFTLEGNVVLMPIIFIHTDYEQISLSDIILLDGIQKQKIDMADEIFVINKNGYLDESTRNEIYYATICKKTIKYMENNYK